MFPEIANVQFEETADRLKVTLPVRRRLLVFILFSVMLVMWLVGLAWGITFTVRDIAFSGERYALVFTIMLVAWLYLWYRLGKVLWQQWQYYAASREILFVEKERLIIRRPVTVLGITDAYDLNYMAPFFYSAKHGCPGFEYGKQRVYFGQGLDDQASQELVQALNERCFSFVDEDY